MCVEYDEKFVYAVRKAIEFAERKLFGNKSGQSYRDLHMLYSLEAGEILGNDVFEKAIQDSCEEAFKRWKVNRERCDGDLFGAYSGILWDMVRDVVEKVAEAIENDEDGVASWGVDSSGNFTVAENAAIVINDEWAVNFKNRHGLSDAFDFCLDSIGKEVLKALGIDGCEQPSQFLAKARDHWVDYASGRQLEFVIGERRRVCNSCLASDNDFMVRTTPWWNGNGFVRRNLPPFGGERIDGTLSGRKRKISTWIVYHAICLRIVSSEISKRSNRWLLLVRRVVQQMESRFYTAGVSSVFDESFKDKDELRLMQIAAVILSRILEDMLYAKANASGCGNVDLLDDDRLIDAESIANSLFSIGADAIGGSVARLTLRKSSVYVPNRDDLSACRNSDPGCAHHLELTMKMLLLWADSAGKHVGEGHAIDFCGIREKKVYDIALIIKAWVGMCDEVERACNQSPGDFLVEELWRERSGAYKRSRGKPCDDILENGPETDMNSIRNLVMERRKRTLYDRLQRSLKRSGESASYDAIAKQVDRALSVAYGLLYVLDGLGNAFDECAMRNVAVKSRRRGSSDDYCNSFDRYVVRKLGLLGDWLTRENAFCRVVWSNATVCMSAVTFNRNICRWCLDMSVVKQVWSKREPGHRVLVGRSLKEMTMLAVLGLGSGIAESPEGLMEREIEVLHLCEHEIAQRLRNNGEVACCKAARMADLCMETV